MMGKIVSLRHIAYTRTLYAIHFYFLKKIMKNFFLFIGVIIGGVLLRYITEIILGPILGILSPGGPAALYIYLFAMFFILPPITGLLAGYLFYHHTSIKNKVAKILLTIIILLPLIFWNQITHYFFIKSSESTYHAPKVGQSLSPQFDENEILQITDMGDNVRDLTIYKNWLCYSYTFDDSGLTWAVLDLDTFSYVAHQNLDPKACRFDKSNRLMPRRPYNANGGYTIQLNLNNETEIYDSSEKLVYKINKFFGWTNAPVVVGSEIIYVDFLDKIHIYNYLTGIEKIIVTNGPIDAIDMNEQYAAWKEGGVTVESGQIFLYKK